jgi:hypothetical protein
LTPFIGINLQLALLFFDRLSASLHAIRLRLTY